MSDAASPKLIGRRALIIAHSPFEAPAMAARLKEAGAAVARAEGLEEGLRALRLGPQPDVVIVDCALGVEATNRLAIAARGGRRAQKPRPVFALRAARLRAELAAGFRWLARQAGPRALAFRTARRRISDARDARRSARAAVTGQRFDPRAARRGQ